MVLSPGAIVDNRYQVVSLLGEGAMGTVYSVMHLQLEKMVALKVLKAECLADAHNVARFRNEARILSSLHHQHIVAVHGVGLCEHGQPYMAMDLVRGKSLRELLKQTGAFARADAVEIALQLADALRCAHEKQIIHRDIKPSNIIVEYDNASHQPQVKLVDFGIAKLMDGSQNLTQAGHSIGSLAYLNLERLEGKPATAQSDIYGLGCTLYEVLTGHHPYPAHNVLDLVRLQSEGKHAPFRVDDDLNGVLNRMLSQHASERYGSAEEVFRDLAAIKQKKRLQHRPAYPRKRPIRIQPKFLVAFMSIVVMFLIVAGARAYSAFGERNGSSGLAAVQEVEQMMRSVHRAKSMDQRQLAVLRADEALNAAKMCGNPLLIAEADILLATVEGFRPSDGSKPDHAVSPAAEQQTLAPAMVRHRQFQLSQHAKNLANEVINSGADPIVRRQAYATKFQAVQIMVKAGGNERDCTPTQLAELAECYKNAAGLIPKVSEDEYLHSALYRLKRNVTAASD